MSSILKKLLAAAFVLYVLGTCWTQISLIERLGVLEHQMFHLLGGTDQH